MRTALRGIYSQTGRSMNAITTTRPTERAAIGLPAAGPWFAGPQVRITVGGYSTEAIPVAQRDVARAVCLVYAGHGDGHATAALIALAPELLQAAQAALECIERHVPPSEFAPRQRLRELLARAAQL